MLDFGGVPPEVTSALMYAGPGSAPMIAAAAAWDALAEKLTLFASGYSSALADLRGVNWAGPASEAMARAATPYAAWAAATAVQAELTAGRARAAAAAYEAAFAATVPPAVVTANRVALATLVATNFFGQNAPLIAANEVAYGEMWAQDAAVMFGYAASSAAAADLAPFAQPPRVTNAAGSTGGHGLAALAQAVPSTRSPGVPAAESSTILALFDELTVLGRSGDVLSYNLRTAALLGDVINEGNLYGLQAGNVAATPLVPPATTGGVSAGSGSRAVLAGMSRTESVGRLSVPQGWSMATAVARPVHPLPQLSKAVFRALPPWAGEPPANLSSAAAASGLAPAAQVMARPLRNTARRMQVRRFQMPRPAVGG